NTCPRTCRRTGCRIFRSPTATRAPGRPRSLAAASWCRRPTFPRRAGSPSSPIRRAPCSPCSRSRESDRYRPAPGPGSVRLWFSYVASGSSRTGDHNVLEKTVDDSVQGRRAARTRGAHAGARRALREREPPHPAVSRWFRARDLRHGLFLGRGAEVLAASRRVQHRGRIRRRSDAEPGRILRPRRHRRELPDRRWSDGVTTTITLIPPTRGPVLRSRHRVSTDHLLRRRGREAAGRAVEGRARAVAPIQTGDATDRPGVDVWRGEEDHQHFYRTHAAQYRMYRVGCGRDARLRELWGRGN